MHTLLLVDAAGIYRDLVVQVSGLNWPPRRYVFVLKNGIWYEEQQPTFVAGQYQRKLVRIPPKKGLLLDHLWEKDKKKKSDGDPDFMELLFRLDILAAEADRELDEIDAERKREQEYSSHDDPYVDIRYEGGNEDLLERLKAFLEALKAGLEFLRDLESSALRLSDALREISEGKVNGYLELLNVCLDAAADAFMRENDIDAVMRELAERAAPRDIRIMMIVDNITVTVSEIGDLATVLRRHESEWQHVVLELERERQARLRLPERPRGLSIERW